ncbi:MAG: L-lactate utilization protein LutC [Verrucomicrobiota bacterium]|jgi:L-lactate dehydrogenase complex protein LldG
MSSRDTILASLRQNRPPAPEALRPPADFGISYPDKQARLAEALLPAGGELVPCSRAELAERIRAAWPEAKKIYAPSLPELHNVPLPEAGTDPKIYNELDLCLIEGPFAVAENAAVWIPHGDDCQRSAPFLAVNLALVVPADQILDNMHQAMRRLASSPLPQAGAFIAGPSKTADIEQCLVIGAHGPCMMRLFLVS